MITKESARTVTFRSTQNFNIHVSHERTLFTNNFTLSCFNALEIRMDKLNQN